MPVKYYSHSLEKYGYSWINNIGFSLNQSIVIKQQKDTFKLQCFYKVLISLIISNTYHNIDKGASVPEMAQVMYLDKYVPDYALQYYSMLNDC